MKKAILLALTLFTCSAFANVNAPGEYVLASMSVTYLNRLEMMSTCDLDIRHIVYGSLKGTWLHVNQEDQVLLSLDGPVKDSIPEWIGVYKKWAEKAKASDIELTKDIASHRVKCVYFLDNDLGIGLATATLTFRFASFKGKNSGKLITNLLIMFTDIESTTNEYHHVDIGGMFLFEGQDRMLRTNIWNIPDLKKKALEKQKAADEFTR